MAESATSVGSLTFLGLFAMFSLSPRVTLTHPGDYRANAPASPKPISCPTPVAKPRRSRRLVRRIRKTSYWLGGANEMAAINTILIIVNSPTPYGLTVPQNSRWSRPIEATFRQKQGELAAAPPTFR